MEIERKWMVQGRPQGMEPAAEYQMEQGYLALAPTVRIRREARLGGDTAHILCIKGKGLLSREEIELPVEPEIFERLAGVIGKPLIPKTRWDYALPEGLTLEVNRVDQGAPTEFWYAEVEFETEAQARAWQPQGALAAYLTQEVTEQPGQNMGAYWQATRG